MALATEPPWLPVAPNTTTSFLEGILSFMIVDLCDMMLIVFHIELRTVLLYVNGSEFCILCQAFEPDQLPAICNIYKRCSDCGRKVRPINNVQ